MPLRSADPAIEAHRRAGHLTRVKVLRRVLPGVAAALVTLCVAQVATGALTTAAQRPEPAAVDTMLSPRFSGRSADGRSFTITGREGRRLEAGSDKVVIAEPVMLLRSASNNTKRVTANSGVLDQTAHTMVLTGNVKMVSASGSNFSAKEARIDTRTGSVTGQSGLTMESSAGTVQSGSYDAETKGDRVILKGGVRGRLNPKT